MLIDLVNCLVSFYLHIYLCKIKMHSLIKVAIFVLLATVTFTKADNCQYAPGNWIGNGTRHSSFSCKMTNIQWIVEDFSGDATTLAITR